MIYKLETQIKNAEKLQKKFEKDNVPEFIRDFFPRISSRRARINYWVTIRDILVWLLEKKYINRKSISGITPKDMAEIRDTKIILYLGYLKEEKNIKLNTLQTKKNHLGSFWEYLVNQHYVVDNVVHMVKSEEFKPAKTNRRKIAKMPSHDNIEEMIQKINKKKDEFIRIRNLIVLRVFRGTGLRESELAGLDLDDVFLEEEYPYILVISKGSYDYTDEGKDIVYLTKDAASALYEWIDYRKSIKNILDVKAVFINKNGKRLNENNIQKIFENYSGKKISPHMMRHEYITTITRESGDITFAQEQARHKSSNVTMFSYDSGASRSLSILENL